MQSLVNLHSLKVLKLHFNRLSITPLTKALAANGIPIEHFEILGGVIDDDGIKSITQLKKLTVLELFHTLDMTNEHLITIAKELPNFSRISFATWNSYVHHRSKRNVKICESNNIINIERNFL